MKTNHNAIKVTKTIWHLKNYDIFHECFDIIEDDIYDILAAYDVYDVFSDTELGLLKEYLLEQAQRAEFSEAIHLGLSEHDPVLLSIPEIPLPSFKVIAPLNQSFDQRKAEDVQRLLSEPISSAIEHALTEV